MNEINSQDTITIFGGSGFIGRQVVKNFSKTNAKIKIISRSVESELRVCGAVGQIGFKTVDISKMQNFDELIAASTYVINLVGILHQKGSQTFENMHTKVGHLIAKSCSKYNIKRLVHVSALNADMNSPSVYLKTKAEEEKNILDNFKRVVILRPSVVFGLEDDFINTYLKIIKMSLFVPVLSNGNTKIQPIYVKDIATSIMNCFTMEEKDVFGKIFHLGGPKIYTMRRVIEMMLETLNKRRKIVNLNTNLANMCAFFMNHFNKPALSYEKIKLARFDNIVKNSNDISKLNIKPISIETILPEYIF